MLRAQPPPRDWIFTTSALVDSLPGLPNRAPLQARLQAMLDGCAGGASAALPFLDLDRFKGVDADFGRDRGDPALYEVAALACLARPRRRDRAPGPR